MRRPLSFGKKLIFQESIAKASLLLVLLSLSNSQAKAGTLDLEFGGFQIKSSAAGEDGDLSNLGVYRLGYFHPFLEHFNVGVAYTIVMSSVIGGDLGYGLDVGANWYPITQSAPAEARSKDQTYAMVEFWRPYVGISFNQRQYQSIQAGYAGFGGNIGCERTITSTLSAKGEIRYLRLDGPASSTVTEMDAYAGVSVAF